MNIDQAKLITCFLNNYEQHIEKWVIILEREGGIDKFHIGNTGGYYDNTVIRKYGPIKVLSVIVDRGRFIDSVDKEHSAIRADDNLWEVLNLVCQAIRTGGWDNI